MKKTDSLSLMKEALVSLRMAVADELKKKAMLGQKAVVCINGKPCVVAAKTLVKQLKDEITEEIKQELTPKLIIADHDHKIIPGL